MTNSVLLFYSVGGVLTLASFQRDYGFEKAHATRTNSLSVGLQQLGAFVGCFIAWPLTKKLGRRIPLMIFSFVFCIGAMIQTINTGSPVAFYIARVIAGLGLGAATVVVPMYSSEMVPKELRGQIGSFFQFFYTIVRNTAEEKSRKLKTNNFNRVFSRLTGLTMEYHSTVLALLSNGKFLLACNLYLLLSSASECSRLKNLLDG